MAAVEFAIMAPLFGLLIVGITTIALDIKAHSDAREAIRAGAHAVMNGEEDLTVIQQIVTYALGEGGDTVSVQVTRNSVCNGVVTFAKLCLDGSTPEEFIAIDLNMSQDAMVQGSLDVRESIEVRVR